MQLVLEHKVRAGVAGRRFVLAAALAVSLGALAPEQVRAQSTVTYNFGTTTPVATHTGGTYTNVSEGSGFSIGNSNGTVTTPINTTSPSSGYTGASGGENLGNAVPVGTTFSASTSAYYTLTLTPTSGNSLSLSEFDFAGRSTSTGPTTYALYSSLNGYSTPIFTDTIGTNSTYALKTNAFTLNDTTGVALTLRLYTYGGAGNASAGSENSRIDDVALTYTTATINSGTTTYQYFDLNGTTAGSGVANNSTTNTFSGTHFNSVADGTGTTAAFTNDGTGTATFSAGTDSAANTYTVNIDTAVMTNGITFNDANVTLAHATGGSLTLTGASINVVGAAATISEAIGGTVGLTKDGAGILTLSSTSSTFTGNVTIDMGTLSVSSDANLGTSTNAVVLSGGTLQTTTGFSTARGFTGTGSLDIAAGSTLTSTGTFNTTGVTLVNTGTLSLTGTGTGQGVGNLTFNATATVSNTTGSAIAVNNVTVGTGSTGIATISGPISLVTGTHTFTVPDTNTSGVDLEIDGVVSGTGGISKSTGAGTLALNGSNTFSGTLQLGGTAVTGGTISVGNANALGTGAFNFNDGTVSNDTGAAISTARVLSIGATGGTGVTGGATFAGSNITVTGGVSFYSQTAATQVITVNNHTTFSGVVATGSAASTGVAVNGTGTLTLTGANTFVQALTVSGGATVEAAGTGTTGALAANASLAANTGGTLLFSTANQAKTTAGVTLNAGTIGVASGANQGSGATLSGGTVSGTSAVGLGALTLAGNSTLNYTGTAATAVFTSFSPTSGGTFTLNVTGSNFGTTTASADSVNNRLIFNQDVQAAGFLGDITFNGIADATEMALDTGFWEITPGAPVPEPATVFAGILLVGALGWNQRRRLGDLAGLLQSVGVA